jgi:hypothetical protein
MVIGVALGAALLLVLFVVSSLSPPATAANALPPTTSAIPVSSSSTSIPYLTSAATFTPIALPLASPNLAGALGSSPTPDPVLAMIATGDLLITGPLLPAQQVSLYRASMSYVQATVEDSLRAAKEINAVGYGDPSNICGPLAVAILRDAGIIDPYLEPHDYWLLDPTKVPDQRLITNAFPAHEFAHEVIPTQLNKIDWGAEPLKPGDFLFIWHGSWGNFDHMLVVNRVDKDGRAYTVTNFGTPEGYMIAETMLYDPRDVKAGIFHTWTRQRDQVLGSTGFGGFELWRAIVP